MICVFSYIKIKKASSRLLIETRIPEMWYRKEYIFFKNLAKHFQLPVWEVKEELFADFLKSKTGVVFPESEKEYDHFYQIMVDCPEKKIVYFLDREGQCNLLFLKLPDLKEGRILLLGPFHRRNYEKAYALIYEFGRILWKDMRKVKYVHYH